MIQREIDRKREGEIEIERGEDVLEKKYLDSTQTFNPYFTLMIKYYGNCKNKLP